MAEYNNSHDRLKIKSQDLRNVCQFLINLTHDHTIQLGIELGLYYPTLEKMNNLPTEMVVAWLNRQDNVLHQSGEPTWKGLADALEKIGQVGIAQDIRRRECCDSSAADTQQDVSGSDQSRSDHAIGTDTSGIIEGSFSAETREDLHQRIHNDVSTLKHKFSHLQAIARESIKDHKKLIAHVICMDILSKKHERKVRRASNTDEVFIVVGKYWSFLDFGNLKDIIENNCGEDEQILTLMKNYGKEVKKFCEKGVSEFPPDSLCSDISHASDGMDVLHFVIDLTNPSLKRIKDLKRVIATILELNASKLVLVNIGVGSVVATILTTTSTAKQICSLSKKQEDVLKALQIVSLKFRSTLIFDTQIKAGPLPQSVGEICDITMTEVEPSPRFWHLTFTYKGKVFLWGGSTQSEKNQLATTLNQFDIMDEKWQQRETKGIPHPQLTQIACACHCVNGVLYTYGSDDRKVLSQLDLERFEWSQLWSASENDDGNTPMIKASAGMAYFAKGHLAVFGGYAYPSGPRQPGSDFRPNRFDKGKGWTNEFHIFHISEEHWLSPLVNGRPPPCSDFTLNGIDDYKAALFGGYQPGGSRDELYIIHFDLLGMEIRFDKIEKTSIWPEGRECPSGCCLGLNTEYPQLLISGGKNRYDTPLKFDMWMLDIKSEKWKKVQLSPGKRTSRWGHSMATVITLSGLEAVIMFGGSSDKFGSDWKTPKFSRLAETKIYYFGNHDSEWTLLEEKMSGKSTTASEWTQFELDNQLSMKIIFLMEKAYRVPLLSELTKKQSEFQEEILGVSSKSGIVSSISQWLKSSGNIEPTWQNLFDILRRINLSPLAWRLIDCILRAMIDTAETLENDLISHSSAIPGEEKDVLRQQRIQSFINHSNITISILKRKYDDLRIENELLENSPRAEFEATCTDELISESSVMWLSDDENVESNTTRPTIKSEPKDESTDKVTTIGQKLPSPARGKEEIPTHKWEDPMDIKMAMLKKENKELRDLEKFQQDVGKEKITAQSHNFELPGVDVCGETTFVVTHNADVFKWEEYGLELYVSEDSLPKDMDKCKISIIASIAGQYQFPETFSLVSAVFWVRWEPTCKFSKDITMKMEHCAKSENAPTKLSFVRTFYTPKKFPYTFEKIGGCFTKADGTIELKGSSGLAIAASDPNEQEYCARIFYLSQPRVTSYEIDFIVTWNLKAHHTVVKEEYEGKFAVPGTERTFFFESDSITIDIPLGGVEIEKGWKIKPLTIPMVLKQIVDSYEEGKVIPKCQFSAKTMIPDGEEVPPLQHQATLFGAKYPDNNIIIVTFNITPTSRIISGSSHASRNRKRPAFDSDIAPSPKRILLHKTKSQDSNIPITSEDVDTSEDLSTDLQGVEVLQKTTVTVTNSGCTFVWEGYGLKLHIPENSLPSDMKQIKLTIVASIAGHYMFPENFSLFSGVYWFCYEPLNVKLQLKKPVKLEIQHCAKSDYTSSLSFVRASSSPEKLPYTFKCLKGGDFTSCSSYGTLEVNNFCGICIAGILSRAKKYLARVFYLRHEIVYWDIRLAVILNTKIHRTASEEEFSKKPDTEQPIDFESDEITLDFPRCALEIEGWKLYTNGHPMVEKEVVDNFLPGQSIPHCQIFAALMDPGKARGRHIRHHVNLRGAKAPSNYIELHLLIKDTDTSLIGSSSVFVPQLPDLLRELQPTLANRWKDIGVMLRIPVDRLAIIQADNSSDCSSCMREMLRHYLQQVTPLPSWDAIIAALKSLKLDHVAERIRSKYL